MIGEVQGTTSVTLTSQEMPSHNHPIVAADPGNPANRFPGPSATAYLSGVKGGFGYQKVPVTPNVTFSPNAITPAGSSVPHDNMQPYLTMSFCIALFGIFPQHQ